MAVLLSTRSLVRVRPGCDGELVAEEIEGESPHLIENTICHWPREVWEPAMAAECRPNSSFNGTSFLVSGCLGSRLFPEYRLN